MWKRIDDFTEAQIAPRASGAGKVFRGAGVFDQVRSAVAVVQPGAWSEALDERFFGLHHDLPPELIARQLGGTMVWKREDDGMWIALIRFDRQVEARLDGNFSFQLLASSR